jgi:uncharacterized protein YyaL (SSP411 family)
LCEVQHDYGYWDQFDYLNEIHSYSSRVAWALLEAEKITNIPEFEQAAYENLNWVAINQTNNNWFEKSTFSSKHPTYLHTIAYTIRGLLEGGYILDDDYFISTAKRTADKLLELHHQYGPLQGSYDQYWESKDFFCLTGNAQIALVWLRLYHMIGNEQYKSAAEEEIQFIKQHQVINERSTIYGGIKGSDPVWGPYLRLRYPNWAPKFFIDCLLMS